MKSPSYCYRTSDIRVIDGDTIEATVDLGFYTSQRLRFRLARLNAYEINSKIDEERQLAAQSKKLLFNLLYLQDVVIESRKTEKYGRWLAEIFIGDSNVNDQLLNSGLVKTYV